jgi:hypothetical protein
MVVKAGKIEESFLVEEKLLRGHQEKPQERKSNPVNGKEVATGSSEPVQREGLNDGLSKHFQ